MLKAEEKSTNGSQAWNLCLKSNFNKVTAASSTPLCGLDANCMGSRACSVFLKISDHAIFDLIIWWRNVEIYMDIEVQALQLHILWHLYLSHHLCPVRKETVKNFPWVSEHWANVKRRWWSSERKGETWRNEHSVAYQRDSTLKSFHWEDSRRCPTLFALKSHGRFTGNHCFCCD